LPLARALHFLGQRDVEIELDIWAARRAGVKAANRSVHAIGVRIAARQRDPDGGCTEERVLPDGGKSVAMSHGAAGGRDAIVPEPGRGIRRCTGTGQAGASAHSYNKIRQRLIPYRSTVGDTRSRVGKTERQLQLLTWIRVA
jgi:hypothetical protein